MKPTIVPSASLCKQEINTLIDTARKASDAIAYAAGCVDSDAFERELHALSARLLDDAFALVEALRKAERS